MMVQTVAESVAGCMPLSRIYLIFDQVCDIPFRIQQGLSRDKKTVAVGPFPGQLEAVLKVTAYFLIHIFKLEGGRYQFLDDKINGVFFKNDINIMLIEKVQLNFFDFIIMGFNSFNYPADVQRVSGIGCGNNIDA